MQVMPGMNQVCRQSSSMQRSPARSQSFDALGDRGECARAPSSDRSARRRRPTTAQPAPRSRSMRLGAGLEGDAADSRISVSAPSISCCARPPRAAARRAPSRRGAGRRSGGARPRRPRGAAVSTCVLRAPLASIPRAAACLHDHSMTRQHTGFAASRPRQRTRDGNENRIRATQPLFEPRPDRAGDAPRTASTRCRTAPAWATRCRSTLAAMRGMKAEGGWGVVCTEYCSIHPTLRRPAAPVRLAVGRRRRRAISRRWPTRCTRTARSPASSCGTAAATSRTSPRRAPTHRRALDARRGPTRSSRSAWIGATSARSAAGTSRRPGARKQAGFDIVYVYPTHGYLVSEFLSRALNDRSDEYGGSLENRVRLMRELIEETRDAVGDRCAVAVRFSADGHGEEHLSAAEARDVIGMLGQLPDLWDVVVADYYGEEMATSRFVQEAALEDQGRLRPGADRQAGGQRRPLHLAGHDAAPDAQRRPRLHRRRAPVDRRSLPADQDPRGPPRGHPRVHRLQHLLRAQLPRRGAALHAEPDHGRGMAQRLAPGAACRRATAARC